MTHSNESVITTINIVETSTIASLLLKINVIASLIISLSPLFVGGYWLIKSSRLPELPNTTRVVRISLSTVARVAVGQVRAPSVVGITGSSSS